jgi:hypothetical protein
MKAINEESGSKSDFFLNLRFIYLTSGFILFEELFVFFTLG